MSLLRLENLSVDLGRRPVIRGVSLTVSAGECVALIGPNGAGKSTLLRAALGLVPHRGCSSLAALPRAARAKAAAFMPQTREIAWPVTVETVAGLGLRGGGADDRAAVKAAMARAGVAEFAARRADSLSGGEQARVLLARALAQRAPLLLADEPTAGLDPAHQIAAMEIFAGLAAEGRSVLVSLHDLGLAARWCARVVLLDAGRILADGPPEEVLTCEALRRVYGVDAYVAQGAAGLIVQPLRRV